MSHHSQGLSYHNQQPSLPPSPEQVADRHYDALWQQGYNAYPGSQGREPGTLNPAVYLEGPARGKVVWPEDANAYRGYEVATTEDHKLWVVKPLTETNHQEPNHREVWTPTTDDSRKLYARFDGTNWSVTREHTDEHGLPHLRPADPTELNQRARSAIAQVAGATEFLQDVAASFGDDKGKYSAFISALFAKARESGDARQMEGIQRQAGSSAHSSFPTYPVGFSTLSRLPELGSKLYRDFVGKPPTMIAPWIVQEVLTSRGLDTYPEGLVAALGSFDPSLVDSSLIAEAPFCPPYERVVSN